MAFASVLGKQAQAALKMLVPTAAQMTADGQPVERSPLHPHTIKMCVFNSAGVCEACGIPTRCPSCLRNCGPLPEGDFVAWHSDLAREGRGPGTELKKLLSKIGITATPTCKCNARARYMDEQEAKEPGWCERNIEEIVGYLREAAADRGLPFLDVAGRLLIRRAIANAKRAALDEKATVNGERNSPDAAAGRPPHHD